MQFKPFLSKSLTFLTKKTNNLPTFYFHTSVGVVFALIRLIRNISGSSCTFSIIWLLYSSACANTLMQYSFDEPLVMMSLKSLSIVVEKHLKRIIQRHTSESKNLLQ